MALLNAIVTLVAMATFLGIAWWAFSKGRSEANREASMLPFMLPDEPASLSNSGKNNE